MANVKSSLRKIKRMIERAYCFVYSFGHPIQKQVVFESFSGKQYSDNPRAISERLHDMYPDYTIYWKLKNAEDKYGLVPEYVKVIPDETGKLLSIKYLKTLFTSCAYVTNESLTEGMAKRKGQFYVSTWHGDRGFKKVLADLEYFQSSVAEDYLADICVAGSDYGENQFRTAFRYTGEILKCGTPRDDVLLNCSEDYKNSVLERIGLQKDYKYLLYAPTYNDNDTINPQYNNALSLSRTIVALETKMGEKWKVLSRAHSESNGGLSYLEQDRECIIDVSDYPDMADILLIADALITDYSSSPGDAALRNIPIFLFQNVPYTRPLYFQISESPFWVAHNQAELEQLIEELTEDGIKANCISILNFYGTCESGKASTILADRINEEYLKLVKRRT